MSVSACKETLLFNLFMKKCTKCLIEKELDCFYYRCNKPESRCKSCMYEKNKEYNQKNPDKIRESKRKCRQKYKQRDNKNRNIYKKIHKFKTLAERANWHSLKKSDNERISYLDLYKIAKRQKLICPVSGIKLTAENISVDHIIPFSNGGKNIPENIRLVDWNINQMKNCHTEKEFLEIIKRIYLFQTTLSSD